MAFVFVAEVLHRVVAFFEGVDDLFRFGDGDTGIVGAVDDEERGSDVVYMVNRGDLIEEITVILDSAVLRFSQVAAVGAGVLMKVGGWRSPRYPPRRPTDRDDGSKPLTP